MHYPIDVATKISLCQQIKNASRNNKLKNTTEYAEKD